MPIILTMMFLGFVWTAEGICAKGLRWRRPTLTLAVCGLLIACLIAQLMHPELLQLCERNTTRVLQGEWWRLGSALFFQDGWISGGVTNIVTLLFIGSRVEQTQSRRTWLLVSVLGALIAELFALRWQPIGAGNSIATCSLAGYLIMVRPFSGLPVMVKVLRILAIAVSLLLVAIENLHGIAGISGVLLGILKPHQRR